jgi:predicted metalloprotease
VTDLLPGSGRHVLEHTYGHHVQRLSSAESPCNALQRAATALTSHAHVTVLTAVLFLPLMTAGIFGTNFIPLLH